MSTQYVYILTNQSRMLYVGMTTDLQDRVREHRTKAYDGFTAKYNLSQIVYYETCPYRSMAVARERQLKGWSRAKKIALIEKMNPRWQDLSDGWANGNAPGNFTAHLHLRPDPSTADASHPPLRIN